MLLLVAGLVVIVLVILVVVFLSVRSMRADEGNDHPARSAGRGRAASGRGDLRGMEAGRQPGRRRPAEDDWLAGDEPPFAEPEPGRRAPRCRARAATGTTRIPAAVRGRRSGAIPGAGSGRKQAPGQAAAGTSPERTGRPVTGAGSPTSSTGRSFPPTSRSPPPRGPPRPQTAARGRTQQSGAKRQTRTLTRLRPGHARNRPRPWPPRAPPPPSSASVPDRRGRAARLPSRGPPSPPEPFGFADPGATADFAAASGPWADPMSAGSVDTDPSIGMGRWQDAASDTAAWQMPDRDAPATQDSRAWAEDPLTSPSFSESSAHSTDGRSYRGSHTRGRARLDEPGSGFR